MEKKKLSSEEKQKQKPATYKVKKNYYLVKMI